jgi:hypothetical protein
VYLGTISNVEARNIQVEGATNSFRILVGSDALNTANIASAVDIHIKGVHGSSRNPAGVMSTFGSIGAGGVKQRITLSDWSVSGFLSTVRTAVGLPIGGVCDNITLRNWKWGDLLISSGNGALAHQVNLGSDASISRLEIDSYSIVEDASGPATVAPAVAITQGTLDELVMSNCGWTRNAVTNQAFCSISGGTVNRVVLADSQFYNINNAISIAGGTVGGVQTTGLSHRGANSQPSITTSVTLPRLRSSGSDTALLAGGTGTITSKKTDATEDA